jgi:hypothetical protein
MGAVGAWRFVVAALVAAALAGVPAAQDRGENLVLVTLDGARVEEMFGGLDASVLRSTLPRDAVVEEHPLYKRFGGATPEARRVKLLPFFWGELMTRHGSIAGNPRLGSSVRLTNAHGFSYPGYSEILVGEADDKAIATNDRVNNPRTTVLEALKAHLRLSADQAAVFGSWEVLNEIVERAPGTLAVNAGYEASTLTAPGAAEISRLQVEAPTPWNSVRHDAYTFALAKMHLSAVKPRVFYLALGETDDWAHDGRYDRTLESYARADAFLRDLWEWLQAQPEYRDRTHILITTDHGRGRFAADWRQHGAKVEGSRDIWMAFVSPRVALRGEWRSHPPLFANQAAATMADWMGLDWSAGRPLAGRPIAFTQ